MILLFTHIYVIEDSKNNTLQWIAIIISVLGLIISWRKAKIAEKNYKNSLLAKETGKLIINKIEIGIFENSSLTNPFGDEYSFSLIDTKINQKDIINSQYPYLELAMIIKCINSTIEKINSLNNLLLYTTQNNNNPVLIYADSVLSHAQTQLTYQDDDKYIIIVRVVTTTKSLIELKKCIEKGLNINIGFEMEIQNRIVSSGFRLKSLMMQKKTENGKYLYEKINSYGQLLEANASDSI